MTEQNKLFAWKDEMGEDYVLPPATGTTLGGVMVDGTSIIVDSSGKITATAQEVDAYTKTESDAKFVDVSGDTMEGSLTALNFQARDIAQGFQGIRISGDQDYAEILPVDSSGSILWTEGLRYFPTADKWTVQAPQGTAVNSIVRKDYVDTAIASIPVVDAYTKAEADALYAGKSDVDHGHSEYMYISGGFTPVVLSPIGVHSMIPTLQMVQVSECLVAINGEFNNGTIPANMPMFTMPSGYTALVDCRVGTNNSVNNGSSCFKFMCAQGQSNFVGHSSGGTAVTDGHFNFVCVINPVAQTLRNL